MTGKSGKKSVERSLKKVRAHLVLLVLGCLIAIGGLLRTQSPLWLLALAACLWLGIHRLQDAALLSRSTEGQGSLSGVSVGSRAGGFKSSLRNRVLVYALLVAGVIAAAMVTLNKSPGEAGPATSRYSPDKDSNGLNRCFAKGSDIAQVYFANASAAMDSKVLPSEMRDNGCRQIAVELGSTDADCMGQCAAGFSYQAKKFLKGN